MTFSQKHRNAIVSAAYSANIGIAAYLVLLNIAGRINAISALAIMGLATVGVSKFDRWFRKAK